eukprot:4290503-Alexandrium_andersonii.AAC.1
MHIVETQGVDSDFAPLRVVAPPPPPPGQAGARRARHRAAGQGDGDIDLLALLDDDGPSARRAPQGQPPAGSGNVAGSSTDVAADEETRRIADPFGNPFGTRSGPRARHSKGGLPFRF